jgi:hypothetical protein
MELNLNFVLFEELREKTDSSGAVARIVVIRESKGTDFALEEGATDFYSLE